MESRSIVRGMSVAETAESGSLSKLRYFVLDAVVINGSAFRFIVHFRRDWFRGIGFVAVSRANTSTTIAPVFVANYGRCLFPEPSYIYIYTPSPRQKLCQLFQRILPISPSSLSFPLSHYIAGIPNFYDHRV